MKTATRLLRRVRRCHPMTWLVAVAAAVVMVLITLPGETFSPGSLEGSSGWEKPVSAVIRETRNFNSEHGLESEVYFFEHGWPLPAFVRSLNYDPPRRLWPPDYKSGWSQLSNWPLEGGVWRYYTPGWSQLINWPLESDVWRLYWPNFVVDLAVALAIVLAVAGATELWIRCRGGLLRYRLTDLLAATSVACVVLGWLQYHRSVFSEETRIVRFLDQEAPFNKRRCKGARPYTGPDWLKRLAGEANLPIFHHCQSVIIANEPGVRQGLEKLAKLPYMRSLNIDSPLPKAAIQALAEAGTLERLDYRMDYHFSDPVPGREVQRWLDADDDPELVGPSELDLLAPLKLKSLLLAGDLLILEDFERVLASNPQLELLRLGSVSMTTKEDRELQKRYPEVEIRSHTYHHPGPDGHDRFVERREAMRRLRLSQQAAAPGANE